MAKGIYVGVGGVARKVKKLYVGVDGIARKVKKAYIGIGGVARPFFSASTPPTFYGAIDGMSSGRAYHAAATIGPVALFVGGRTGIAASSVTNTTVSCNESLTINNYSVALVSAREHLAGGSNSAYAIFAGGDVDGSYKTYVDAYNSSGSRYNPDINLTTACSYPAAARAGDYVVFAGGTTSSGKTTYVTAYDASLTRVSIIALGKALPTASPKPSGASIAGHALIAYGSTYPKKVVAYNASLSLTALSEFTTERRYAATASTSSHAIFASGENTNVIDAFDTSLTLNESSMLSDYRIGAAATAIGGHAVVVGGYKGTTGYLAAEAIDNTLTVTVLDDASAEHTWFAATTVGNYAIFAGGRLQAGTGAPTTAVDVYTLDI